jgi:hypothetical protein
MRNLRLTVFGLFALVSCASQRPVLYPNDQLKRVGNNMASRDIDDCMRQAEHYVSDRRVGNPSRAQSRNLARVRPSAPQPELPVERW